MVKAKPPVPSAAAKVPAKSARAATKPKKNEVMGAAEMSDQRLGFFMHDVSRLRRTAFDEFMKPLGVTRSQWWVLSHLSRNDGMIQSNLADELALNKASLGALIDRLEASGLVERRADEADRRVKRLFLASKASKFVQEMNSRSHEMSERVLEGLSRKERDELTRMLLRVKQNLQAINQENGSDAAEE